MLLQDNPEIKNQANADQLLKTFDLKQPVYTLQPGDVLSLKVQSTTKSEYNFLGAGTVTAGGDPILEGYTLDAEGNMVLPVVGKVNLKGLSLPDARLKVTEALQPYLKEPTVNMRLLTFRYTIVGEVGGQGQYTTYQDNINLLEAIANAGGFGPYSNRGSIKLIRYENGQAKLYKFSLLDDNVLALSNFYLKPNDTIVIDPLPAKYFRENVIANVGLTLSLFTTLLLLGDRYLF
ncbi:polysaccharide biosynthesis/export family protein [Pontibacter aydingkolensis]